MTKARSNASSPNALGDLVVGTGTGTASVLSIGADGSVPVANSSATTGVNWAGPLFAAGKNKVMNGDFSIWQRGTSFSDVAGGPAIADRWTVYAPGGSPAASVSRQTFTPGTAPVAGYEGQYYCRVATGSGTTYFQIWQPIENVQTFAGQTVTVSFWAKASSSIVVRPLFQQVFGSSGSTGVTTLGTNHTLTTSWTRYTQTVSIPSIAGKTIDTSGTNNQYLQFFIEHVSGTITSNNIDFWGIQVEAGSVATPFVTLTGNPASELAACQRYYWRQTASGSYSNLNGTGFEVGTTSAQMSHYPPVTMRVKPISVEYSNIKISDAASSYAITSLALDSNNTTGLYFATNATISGGTAHRPCMIQANNNSSAYIAFYADMS